MRSTRPYLALALSLTTAAALAGCAGPGDDTTATTYVTETVTRAAEGSPDGSDTAAAGAAPIEAVPGAYSGVLDNPDQYSFTGGGNYSLNGEYQYALVEMTGDGIPELLLKAMTTDHMDPIRVFSASEGGTLVSPDDTLVSGAAGAGGYRAGIGAAPEGDRIFQKEWHSLRPEITVRGFVLQGDRLVPNGEEWEDDQRSPSGRLADITFHSLSDRGPLEMMAPATGAAGTGTGVGGNTATGTVRVLTAPELAQLQGYDQTPNGENSSYRYAVFLFDSPTAFTAKSNGDAGALREREASMALLGLQTPSSSNLTGFDLVGQSMTLSFDRNDCAFPSDASLPLGEPRCSSFTRH